MREKDVTEAPLPGNRYRHADFGEVVVSEVVPRFEGDKYPDVVFQQLKPGGFAFAVARSADRINPSYGWTRSGGGAFYALSTADSDDSPSKTPAVALGLLGLVAVVGVTYIAMRKPEPEA